jgi:hypothetical protein
VKGKKEADWYFENAKKPLKRISAQKEVDVVQIMR